MTNLNWGAMLGGLFLAGGVAFAGLHVGDSLIDMRRADRVVTVKGLSEREVSADVASWRIPFRGQAGSSQAAIAEASRFRDAVRDFALQGGIAESDVVTEPYTLRIERTFMNDGGIQREVARYVAVGAVRLRTTNVDAVQDLEAKTQALLDAGVLLGDNDYAEAAKPEYLFTTLNAIKPALIAEATKAARASAEQFAQDSGSNVGEIASANQGVIQILPRDGRFDERFERNKIVRVVSTVKYYLDD
ncbi:MAG: SIMPL domain-containing protein [Pseudomonadota bacterium]